MNGLWQFMVYANEVLFVRKYKQEKENYRPCTDIGFELSRIFYVIISSLKYKTNHDVKIHNIF